MGSRERFWTSRLRWRLRGATQWPAFVLLTLLDGLVLHLLPPVATTGLNFIEALLIATFGNLFLIGALAPFLARRLMRRRLALAGAPSGAAQAGSTTHEAPALGPTTSTTHEAPALGPTTSPPEAAVDVLRDRTATVLLLLGLLGCLASGLGNREVIVSETAATETAAREVREYVRVHGDPEIKRNLETANTIRLGEGLFRVCIARDDRTSQYCLIVDTQRSPARVDRDPSAEPNSVVTGR